MEAIVTSASKSVLLSLKLEWLQCRHQDTNSCRLTMIKLRGQIGLSKGSFLPPKNCTCAIWNASSIRQRYRAVAWNPNPVYFKRFTIGSVCRVFCSWPWYCPQGKIFLYRNTICLFPDWINLAKKYSKLSGTDLAQSLKPLPNYNLIFEIVSLVLKEHQSLT